MIVISNNMAEKMKTNFCRLGAVFLVVLLAGCALIGTGDTYLDPKMDFGSVKSVAVMPLSNLSHDQVAAERVRDVLSTMLLASGGVYVVPTGEVIRGISSTGIVNAVAPSVDELKKLGGLLEVNAVITGVVREYGEVRAGSATANVISVSLQMIETQTGKVIWSASRTEGGITAWDRLFGGGGKPMNVITEKAVNDLIGRLIK